MTRFPKDALDAPHTQRHLDQIPQKGLADLAHETLAKVGKTGSTDLVRKLRNEWPVGPGNRVACQIMGEAADRIEALEAEVDRLKSGIKFQSEKRKEAEWEADQYKDQLTEARAGEDELAALARLVHSSFGGGLTMTFTEQDVQDFSAALASHAKRKDGR